jgi:predicted NAD-dependent protein-ADP-ribosyltransferase YbiA (DUF1768 family)
MGMRADRLVSVDRYDIVVEGSRHKFNSDPELKRLLLATGDHYLVEVSTVV